MELFIVNDTTLGEISKRCQEYFPFLKIEFSHSEYLAGQMSSWNNKLRSTSSLGEIFPNFHPKLFKFRATDTVKKFKESFEEQVGLVVEVFQKSDNNWIEIVEPLGLSLEKQNAFSGARHRSHYNEHTLFL